MKTRAIRFWSIVLFAALLIQAISYTASTPSTVQAAGEEYGLPAQTKDGLILHAWNWSFDTIKNNLPAIAAAGYKSIQTSPIQGTKESTMDGSKWWLLYQPTNFKIGNAQLGSRDQFKSMCEEAAKYGISIIVDVVANHTANAGGGSQQLQPSGSVDPAIRDNPNFWHQATTVQDWGNRWQVTQWAISLPDLNTSNQELQNMIIGFLNDAISLGADGFRFDAAKHIELPDDPNGAASNFWTRVLGSLTNKDSQFIYGEVLQGGADRFSAYSNYMGLLADHYGGSIRSAVTNKNVDGAKDYSADNVSPSKLVTWVESHDTYANNESVSTYLNDWQIKMGWSIIAARAQSNALFFNRPAGGGKFASTLGVQGNDLWKDADVVAVNKFHNAMIGQGEYLRTQGSQIMLVERGTKGMTIVNLGGDAQINSDTNLANGTYTNKASGGGTFTVSNGKITGFLGSGKIAVLYEAAASTGISIDKAEGAFYTDALSVTMSYSGATSATYSLNNGTATSFSSGSSISFGAGAAIGTSFVLKITAGAVTKTYTFTKADPNAALKVHFYKPSSWGTPNIYYYDDSVTPTKIGAAWPGAAMQDEGNGWFAYSIPAWTQAKVIFNSGSNQLPGASQPGFAVTGEKWIKDSVIYPSNPDVTVVTPTVSIDKAEGTFSTDSLDVTMSYTNATSASYSLNGAAATSFTSGQKITIGAGAASGTAYTLTINASNATAGTSTSKTFTFTKQLQQQNNITVHFYKPAAWGTPNVYAYDESVSPTKVNAAWPGAAMTSEGDGWYSYTLTGWTKANVIFNSNGQQLPASQQAGYAVTQDAWIKDGVITAQKPVDGQMVAVTFNVSNATTVSGQSVYLVGSTTELGNWDPTKAIGPGSTTNYPTWSFTVNLPAGTAIQFKAIKKSGSTVVWEGGANHTYTVSASNPVVNVTFQ
ncbi:alpha amylase catalytic region [Paenibacillus curdlanolyticus YK9]|uniref:Alpha-amylase n=1 Tax=Paenibacillus curdlanolyticus YK9 TaxID=717606 RepID=E0IG14_9BACL|nr:starch-binding protein [Paenibacillus curdlanolyticus]EFM08594.1 alpha amylase catalytic region [Paenibacillus curdlanolyticus YK9]